MTVMRSGERTKVRGAGWRIRPARIASWAFLAMCASVLPLGAQEHPMPLDTLRVTVGSRVSSRLPVLTRSVQLLTRADIDALPVRTLSDVLEWATGVEVLPRSPAQADVSIRGAGFEQVVVLVDGVRMSDPQTGHFDLDLAVPLDRVERVEVLRGPASALYGADAVGGVVNVVTRQGAGALRASAEGGTWGTGRVAVTGGAASTSGRSLSAGAEVSRSDGHRTGTDHETALLHVTGGTPVAGGRMSAELGVSHRDFGAQDFYAPYPSFEKTRSYDASLHYTEDEAGTDGWESRASIRRHDDEFILLRDDPDVYRNTHASYQGGGEVLDHATLGGGKVRVAAGGELYRDWLRSSNLGDRGESRGALFGEAVIGEGGSAVLSAGLRGDWHQGFGSFVSPSVSGSVPLGSALRVRAAAGRSFRAPTWTERYYEDPANIGQADLRPERAWSGELGFDVTGWSSARVGVTGFWRRATSLIDWAKPEGAADGTPWETRNVKAATFQGVEADASVRGPLGIRWTGGATLLSVDAEETTGMASKYALRPQTQRVVLEADRSFGAVALRLSGLRGKRESEAAYHRLDARVSLDAGIGRIHLDLTNLTDTNYKDVVGAAAPGRAFFMGFEVSR